MVDRRKDDRKRDRTRESQMHRTDVRTNERTQKLLTAVYLETAVDAGARIEDSTFISSDTSRVAPIRATLSEEDA